MADFVVTLWRHWWHHHYEFILVDDLHTIFLYLMSNWDYFENYKFSKLTEISGPSELFVMSVIGSEVCYQESQTNFLHFELLIDVLAKKIDGLMALSKFNILSNLVT